MCAYMQMHMSNGSDLRDLTVARATLSDARLMRDGRLLRCLAIEALQPHFPKAIPGSIGPQQAKRAFEKSGAEPFLVVRYSRVGYV